MEAVNAATLWSDLRGQAPQNYGRDALSSGTRNRRSSVGGTPTGVVTYRGTLRQALSALSRFADGYVIEDRTGTIDFFAPRRYTQEGTLTLSADAFDIEYPMTAQYPRVLGVRNRCDFTVKAVTAGAAETLGTIARAVPAGQTLIRTVRVTDDSIVSVANWAAVTEDRSYTARITAQRSREATVLVTVPPGPSDVDVSVQVRGTPYRVSELGGFSVERRPSIDSYGERDMTDEQPDWWSFAGRSAANDILNRLDEPLQFARIRLPGWQDAKAQTDAIYGVQAGDAIRVNIESDDEGVPDLNRNMIVMSVRYTGRLNRIPRVEFDLLELPLSLHW